MTLYSRDAMVRKYTGAKDTERCVGGKQAERRGAAYFYLYSETADKVAQGAPAAGRV